MLVGVVRLPSADQRLPEGIRHFANQVCAQGLGGGAGSPLVFVPEQRCPGSSGCSQKLPTHGLHRVLGARGGGRQGQGQEPGHQWAWPVNGRGFRGAAAGAADGHVPGWLGGRP